MMHEVVAEMLWIGHAGDVRDPRAILEAGIQTVVDLAYEEPPAALPRELLYCRFPLLDGAGNDPGTLCLGVDTVRHLLALRIPTLIACGAGMSRSPVIAALALASFRRRSPDDVLHELANSLPHDVSLALWNEAISAFTSPRPADESPPKPAP